MAIFKILYKKESEHVMEVKAETEVEALAKYKNFDCIRVYEVQGISEEVISVKEQRLTT
ncbi:hypothetical protein [Paenibacillus tundrae]|uniref:hypothetical protein n=1 Tax=Paenibacillus tundrae TaxID=528187 RepID=UPI0022A960A5|nr:hypothetical protein [Paenibacillus tundrae]